jgi:poly-beta-1,6-N-acetyl-D-glucosamine synthase
MVMGGWIEWVLLVSVALVVYTFAGYPLAMAGWARSRPRPVRRGGGQPAVTVIVVACNEAARIQAKIDTCLAQDYPADRLSVLVVSDGSTDGTPERVAQCSDPRVQVLSFAERRGKPACLNDAVAASTGDVLVFTDARQRLSRNAVQSLVENFAEPAVGAVSGELMFDAEGQSDYAQGVDAYWRYEKFIRRHEARVHSVPGVTGALYALRRECFRPIAPDTILDDVAIPMQAVRAGWRVVFDDRALAFDRASQSPEQERVRKLRTLAGNVQLIVRMPWVLLPGLNPIALQFLSHKVLRLVAPWALLAMVVTSGLLARHSTVAAALFAGQLVFYALPLAGRLVPWVARWRPTKLARAFIHLNGYAALAVPMYLRQRNPQLWTRTPAVPTPGAR